MQHQYDSSNEIKLSVIATVKNEVGTIASFVESLLNQSLKPDEVIIVDGNSNDGTNEILKNFEAQKKIRLLVRDCNIAEGRNFAIESANNDYIAVTDAGCIVDKNWLKEIATAFEDPDKPDIVAGNFEFDCQNAFEETVVLSTFNPERALIEAAIYYPSSRSVAFKKCAWEKAKGYPEWLYAAEETLFNIRLFLHIKNNLWSQAKKASQKSTRSHIFWRVLFVMEFVRLIGIAGFIRGRLDRLLNKKFIESHFVWMGVKTLDDLDEKNRA